MDDIKPVLSSRPHSSWNQPPLKLNHPSDKKPFDWEQWMRWDVTNGPDRPLQPLAGPGSPGPSASPESLSEIYSPQQQLQNPQLQQELEQFHLQQQAQAHHQDQLRLQLQLQAQAQAQVQTHPHIQQPEQQQQQQQFLHEQYHQYPLQHDPQLALQHAEISRSGLDDPHTQVTTTPPHPIDDGSPFTFGDEAVNAQTFTYDLSQTTWIVSDPISQSYSSPVSPMSADDTSQPHYLSSDVTSPGFVPIPVPEFPLQESSPSARSPGTTDELAVSPRKSSATPPSSPDTAPTQKRTRKKRPVLANNKVDTKPVPMLPKVKRATHNMIEKRYRNNLNDKIALLRDSVPSLRAMSRHAYTGGNGKSNSNSNIKESSSGKGVRISDSISNNTGDGKGNSTGNSNSNSTGAGTRIGTDTVDSNSTKPPADEDSDRESLQGLLPAHKLNKATVLSKATEYILHLEKRNKELADENSSLKYRMDTYESGPVLMEGSNFSPAVAHIFSNGDNPDALMSGMAAAQGANQGQSNAYSGWPGAQSAHTQGGNYAGSIMQPPMIHSQFGGNFLGKLIVGSMAALVLFEGYVTHEGNGKGTDSKGLSALPVKLISKLVPQRFATSQIHGIPISMALLPLMKLFLVMSALLYLLSPLFDFKPRSNKKSSRLAMSLSAAPSPSSPVEVRRKAWLTAIQTVWVPRHSFVLEAAALALKTCRLSARKLIGWRGYSMLTGITQEQEIARVKAWEIALDAQLAGGDAEISISRLVLTLMASGTLPDSPSRLMLKSMHIRVLLRECAKSGYAGGPLFDELSAALARHYWKAARIEHKISGLTVALKGERSRGDALPNHLVSLLAVECDSVFTDRIVQRAYNLAWNRPISDRTDANDLMDSVTEDSAIRSPLDALAAWYSSFTLNRLLVLFLASGASRLDKQMQDLLDLALETAPAYSGAQIKALVAKAVLVSDDRHAHILEAMNGFPKTRSPQKHSRRKDSLSDPTFENIIHQEPIPNDVIEALTLAKCLWLLEHNSPRSRTDSEMLSTEQANTPSSSPSSPATSVLSGTLPPQRISEAASVTTSVPATAASTDISAAMVQRAGQMMNRMKRSDAGYSLLSFTAAYQLLDRWAGEPGLRDRAATSLEHMAGSMRLWVGHDPGLRAGLSSTVRASLIDGCIAVSASLVGFGDPLAGPDADGGDYDSTYAALSSLSDSSEDLAAEITAANPDIDVAVALPEAEAVLT